ncbi:type IVB secretion system protein IcmH/DotU [Trinickia sp.]|uniref:type IVB secretion system protein IcmH/DotU n=1 Tax=Trinickia sp. TaxID=2571163 RepID=UPI003F805608
MTFALTDTRSPSTAFAAMPLAARVRAAERAANPLLDAARGLLLALADMPRRLDADAAAQLRQCLEQEVSLFAKVCSALGLRAEHARAASYCLCTALDEASMQTSWGRAQSGGVDWEANGLAAVAGHDRQGGDRVFRLIEEALRDPREHFELIEVFQNVLDLGFQGRCRFEAGGRARLQALREQVHEVVVTGGLSAGGISHFVPPPPRRSVDPWVRPKAAQRRRRWIVAGVVVALLIGASGYAGVDRWLAYTRDRSASAMHDRLAQYLAKHLHDEIAAGSVMLVNDAGGMTLSVRILGMFASGEAAAAQWAASIVGSIGRELVASNAQTRVEVVGYADGIPAKAGDQRSNQALSEARAWQVAQRLIAAGVPPQRIRVSGKGDADPVGDNRTAQGRAQNRRVEIVVRR